jgi:hypothetical protein
LQKKKEKIDNKKIEPLTDVSDGNSVLIFTSCSDSQIMLVLTSTPNDPPSDNNHAAQGEELQDDPILCSHCQRTANNGIKCKGICVADSDY